MPRGERRLLTAYVYQTPVGWANGPTVPDESGWILLQATDWSEALSIHPPCEFARLQFYVTPGDSCGSLSWDPGMCGWYNEGLGDSTFLSFENAVICVDSVLIGEGEDDFGGGAESENGDGDVSGDVEEEGESGGRDERECYYVMRPSDAYKNIVSQVGIRFWVQDIWTGELIPNCSLCVDLTVVDSSGWHWHLDNRPSGTIEPDSGNTGHDGWQYYAVLTAPEAASWVIMTVGSAIEGDTCAGGIPIPPAEEYLYCFQVDSLVPYYQTAADTLIGQTDTHPLNHHCTEEMVLDLSALAKAYQKSTGLRLFLNDMSLPKGGLFDFCVGAHNCSLDHPWEPPHKTHRYGEEVDLRFPPKKEHRNKFVDLVDDKESEFTKLIHKDHYHLHVK